MKNGHRFQALLYAELRDERRWSGTCKPSITIIQKIFIVHRFNIWFSGLRFFFASICLWVVSTIDKGEKRSCIVMLIGTLRNVGGKFTNDIIRFLMLELILYSFLRKVKNLAKSYEFISELLI